MLPQALPVLSLPPLVSNPLRESRLNDDGLLMFVKLLKQRVAAAKLRVEYTDRRSPLDLREMEEEEEEEMEREEEEQDGKEDE